MEHARLVKQKLFIGLFAFIIASPTFAQTFGLSFSGGLNNSSLKDLKNITNDYIETFHNLGIEVHTFDNFPGYYYVDPRFCWYLRDNVYLGIHLLYTSTGSRAHYIDYSGELRLDQIVELFAPGLDFGYRAALKNHFELWITLQADLLKTNYNFTHLFKLWDKGNTTRLKYTSNGASFEPGIRGIYLFHNFEIGLQFNMRLTTAKYLTAKIDGQKEYLYLHGQQLKADWDGFRIGLTVGWRFNFTKDVSK